MTQFKTMELKQAIELINDNSLQSGSKCVWADLGCGSGLFTYALANLLPKESTLYAIDKSTNVLQKHPNPNKISIEQKRFDFINDEMDLPLLNGILMANSLHYVRDKDAFIKKLNSWIKPNAVLLIVEYDTDKSNPWVPYPASFKTLKSLFRNAGYHKITKLGEIPSLFRSGNIYGASLSK